MKILKKYIKPILIGSLIILVVTFLYLRDKENITGIKLPSYNVINQKGTSLIPGTGTKVSLVKATPVSDSVIDTAFLGFEFSGNVRAEDFTIEVTPAIALDTEVKVAQPNILWISPKKMWDEGTRHRITIKGAYLDKDIVYYTTFRTPEPIPITSGGKMH